MTHSHINLAQEIIWPRRKRQLAYRLMLSYLSVMALILFWIAGGAPRRIHAGIEAYRKNRALETEFAQSHPDSPDLRKHAEQLQQQLLRDAARIQAISDALPSQPRNPLSALVLLANQPDSHQLYLFSFSQQTRSAPAKILFDLTTPAGKSHTGSLFLDKWNGDPMLTQHFRAITQLQVRRAERLDGPVLITQYEVLSKE